MNWLLKQNSFPTTEPKAQIKQLKSSKQVTNPLCKYKKPLTHHRSKYPKINANAQKTQEIKLPDGTRATTRGRTKDSGMEPTEKLLHPNHGTFFLCKVKLGI